MRLLRSPDEDEGDDSDADSANPLWVPPSGTGRDGGEVQVELWTTETIAVRVSPRGERYAVLRLERFPAWRVLLNGVPCDSACVPREDGLLAVRVPMGQMSEIDARYCTMNDVWMGRALSFFALALLLGFAGWAKRREEREAADAQL